MNKNGQLVTGDKARPAKKQHTRPCKDCPWSRSALKGWLGRLLPQDWIMGAHGEMTADCHTVSNQQCAGLAIYRANVCKSVRDPNALRLPADRIAVFSSPAEFLAHHARSTEGAL